MKNVVIEPATDGDLPAVRRLLDDAGLPVADLVENTAVRFWVARHGEVVGAIGLEPFGTAGLLRSLVVSPQARRHGLGEQLVRTVEQAAGENGLHQLVLLTQTAEQFFAARGYTVIDRARVPARLQASREFTSLCPASAACMSKSLRDPS